LSARSPAKSLHRCLRCIPMSPRFTSMRRIVMVMQGLEA
jgi:hypothetical protein